MKIIDLLNKIANGEEIPKKIRVHYRIFEKYLNHNAYLNTEDKENYKYLTDLPKLFDDDRDWLNEEIEIIEEDKKIEKLSILTFSDLMDMEKEDLVDVIKAQRFKLNEIIDYLMENKK